MRRDGSDRPPSQVLLLAAVATACIGLGCTARQQPDNQQLPTIQPATQPTTKVAVKVELPHPAWVTSRQLEPGVKSGTFRYVETIKASFSSRSEPVRASIFTSANLAKVQEVDLGDLRGNLRVDLKPGTYNVTLSASSPDGVTEYQPVSLAEFHIDKGGTLRYLYPEGTYAQFILKVKGLTPAHDEVVNEATPTLRWEPVPDAAYYEVGSLNGKFTAGQTTASSFKPKNTLDEDDECGWMVTAFRPDHQPLATANAWFLTHGSAPEPQTPTSAPTQPLGGYIGIAVGPSTVGMTGTRVRFRDGRPTGFLVGEGDTRNIRPAIYISAILPDSAAIDAGLLPGDEIDRINGKSVEASADRNDQVDKFISLIRSLPAETVVKLRVIREGEQPREVAVRLVAGN